MKFKFDHDYHIHSKISSCSNDPEQTAERILQYACDNNLREICITDHYWDSAVDGASNWYKPQDFEHISAAKPLPKADGVKFLFGCETDMDKFFTVGIPKERFDDFDFERIAEYDDRDVERIMNTEGVIRSEPKIRGVINNARCFLDVRREFGSFSEYIWSYTDGKTVLYDGHADGYIPNSNGLSDAIAKDLKKRGFKYIGSVTLYSHLQACGIINDHSKNCPRYAYINEHFETITAPPDTEHNVVKY